MSKNHYEWIETNLPLLLTSLGIDSSEAEGMGLAHGDKCYQYKQEWEDAGVPWFHGVGIYMLSYINPYEKEVRNTTNGWVPVEEWVIDFYQDKGFL